MKTITHTVYTVHELRKLFPDSFRRAFDLYKRRVEDDDGALWSTEIMESLKVIFKEINYPLRGWNIGAYNPNNYVRFDMPDDYAGLCGKRAHAWLEHRLFSRLRKPYTAPNVRYATEKRHGARRPYTLAGALPDCPLTGVCFDHAFLDDLRDSIKSGMNLKDAFAVLADVAGRLMEHELDQDLSESAFIAECEFTERVFYDNGKEYL